jgi:hypothetical protein
VIFAVDFDGTCVEHMFPDVGPDVPGAVDVLRALVRAGHELIVWTMRSGQTLTDAEGWFMRHRIPLMGANENPFQHTWSQSPKAYAHTYIDDAALGCPLLPGIHGDRPMVDWVAVGRILDEKAA